MTQFVIKLPVFMENKCSYSYDKFVSVKMKVKIAKFLWGLAAPRPPTAFGTNLTCSSTSRFAQIFSNMQ